MTNAGQLRALLRGEAMVIAPGAYDGLTARLVAQARFPAVYMTGAGTAVSQGYPDFGLLTMSEMVENAARLVRSVDVPVIADADTAQHGAERAGLMYSFLSLTSKLGLGLSVAIAFLLLAAMGFNRVFQFTNVARP